MYIAGGYLVAYLHLQGRKFCANGLALCTKLCSRLAFSLDLRSHHGR